MKATVDQDLCTECGLCIDLCPEVFEVGDSGTTVVKADPVPSDVEEACRDAADQCPVECIGIED